MICIRPEGLPYFKPYLDSNAPKEYYDGVKYGSPSGLMQIMR
jgi:hypothetical protein